MLPMFLWAFAHDFNRDRLHGNPFKRPYFAGRGGLGLQVRSHVKKLSELVTGADIGSTVQITHQVNQIPPFVTGGEVGPSAFVQVHLERASVLVRAGRVGGGVFLPAVHALAVGQQVRQNPVDVFQ
ncbi:hypothetical protein D3C84_478880 [compost metagenome]